MPDYMFLLESRLSPEQYALLERVQELARSQDLNLYLTGGAVRDLISGQPIRDLDFTVEGNPVRMVRELEKGGARIVIESERLRYYEMVFAGDVDGSIAAARDDVYSHPGAKPEVRFAGITEDLRRRDFSINAIAISLNVQSRGLLLDPTNGLADLERQEVRALSIHAFTNRPIRLIRILRYCARMGFKMESRTQEWFDLAVQRGLHEKMDAGEVGEEIRALTREENPIATLKLWESNGLLDKISSELQRRKPDYESLTKLARVRGNLISAGFRPRLQVPVAYYLFARLKPKEAAAAMRELEFRPQEMQAVAELVPEAQKIAQVLKGRKTGTPREAYSYISSLPAEMIAFIEVELPSPPVLSKFRNYFQKWRPLRSALPVSELSALGVPRGPQFDKIMEQVFEMQLRGRARTPEERVKIFRQLAGIKDEPVKKPEKEKKKRKEQDSAEPSKTMPARPAGAKPTAHEAGPSAAQTIGANARAKHDNAASAERANAKKGAVSPTKTKSSPTAKKSRRAR
jgi:tRNA nucleotidyltransferase (CCA-adding enzyme)